MIGQIKTLIAKLDTPSDRTAEKIIAKLSRIGRPAVPALIAAAKDPLKPRIRKWSLQALGAIGDRRGGPLLIKALSDERMTVRLHAVRGLGRMKFRPAEGALAKLLRDSSGGVRVNALSALINIKARSSSGPVLKALSDEKWYVRQCAATACGELGITRAPRSQKIRSLETRAKIISREDSRRSFQISVFPVSGAALTVSGRARGKGF